MYSLRMPEELIRRLYVLREEHGCGSIRGQILLAVSEYLKRTEPGHGFPASHKPETAIPNR